MGTRFLESALLAVQSFSSSDLARQQSLSACFFLPDNGSLYNSYTNVVVGVGVFVRPPGTISSGRASVLPQMSFFL